MGRKRKVEDNEDIYKKTKACDVAPVQECARRNLAYAEERKNLKN